MGSITLEFPILVQTKSTWGKSSYFIRPLFLSEPYCEHRRFNKAMIGLTKEVRKSFRNFELKRDNLNTLLWFMFHPEIHFKVISLSFYIGQRYISGQFTVVWFWLKGYRIVCLPSFDNFFFIPERKERIDLESTLEKVVRKLFQEKKKKYGDDYNIEEFMTTKGENATVMKLNVHIGDAPFPFEKSAQSFFAALFSSDVQFEGAWEIDRVGQDLNNKYPGDLQRCFYREQLVTRISRVIFGKETIPIVLLGDKGVGKSSIVQECVYRYIQKNENQDIAKIVKTWHIDPTRIVAGMSIVGMWQKRLQAILTYLYEKRAEIKKKSAPDDVLLFDNIVALLRVGKSAQNNMCVADVLKPYLEKRQLQFVIEATPQQWRIVQEWDRRFTDLFQVIRIEEPSLAESTQMVLRQRAILEQENNTRLGNDTLLILFHLQKTYLRQQKMPGNIVNFLQQISVKYKDKTVVPHNLYLELQQTSNLKNCFINSNTQLARGEVMTAISTNLIGQEEAVNAIVDTVHLVKSGLSDPGKPFATYLFIGPTGVGKTEAAKVLTKYLFSHSDKMVRFDMNEFIDSEAVSRLIGNFYQPEGLLTTKILHQPFCVLLFDEIEKAHPDIHDLLLQVLGEGRLTDSIGRTVDFTNTIIIMTSNIGAREVGQSAGFNSSNKQESLIYQKAVENFFRPEFLNRIDKTIAFHKLELSHLVIIARLQINKLLQRDGFIRRTVLFSVSDEALQKVAKKGFDPDLGGRALKRSIERDLTNMVAEKLAHISPDNPILFSILICKDELYPHILELTRANKYKENVVPQMVPEEKLKPFLIDTKKQINILEQTIEQYRPNTNNWRYYLFCDKLRDFQQQIEEDLWSIENYEEEQYLEVSMNVPPVRKLVSKCGYDVLPNIKDMVAHERIVDYLQELYSNSPDFIKENEGKSLQYFLSFCYLQFFGESIAAEKSDVIYCDINSCIAGRGKREILFIAKKYWEILNSIDVQIDKNITDLKQEIQKTGKITFVIEGPKLWEFFRREAGIHMFYETHQTPIPIRFFVTKKNSKENKETWYNKCYNTYENWLRKLEKNKTASYPYKENEILRLYCLPSENTEGTITDLRTGILNKTEATIQDWHLLFFATKGKF